MKLSLFNIHDVALFITVTLCLLLAIFQFFSPDKNKIAKYFLLVFLIDIAIGVGAVLLLWQPTIKIHPLIDGYVIPYILFGSLLLKGPLLYGYVATTIAPEYRFEAFDVFHLMPIVIYFLVLAITSYNTGNMHLYGDKLTRILSFYEWHSVKIIPLVYALMAAHKVHQYRERFKNASSNPSSGLLWLDILVWGALINWGWSLGTHMLGFYLGASIADKFGILDNYITSGLISALLVYSLINTNKQLSINIDARKTFPELNTESKIVEKIVYSMEVEKIFLNPRLNIERLAEHINLPYREVSALINKHFHVNFNEYINFYRINEAKRLLSDAQFFNLPINEIYMQAGFNSKSAFHRFFSRLVGVSPTEFRKLSASMKTNCAATA
ncbi:helix-turn-helix domain-containing protein [Cellvibrio mixtus]|uniref:helix-turn-helix domain-containing protein n=1 Tax=Cellvibrio mixtus TaxID=39650 RepID=UPI000693328D|nr:AraC family transcriptional regulator [Cellvibrio mixtus]